MTNNTLRRARVTTKVLPGSNFAPDLNLRGRVSFWLVAWYWVRGWGITWDHARRNALNVGRKVKFADGDEFEIVDVPDVGVTVMRGKAQRECDK